MGGIFATSIVSGKTGFELGLVEMNKFGNLRKLRQIQSVVGRCDLKQPVGIGPKGIIAAKLIGAPARKMGKIARSAPVQAREPRISCTAGESLGRGRWGN